MLCGRMYRSEGEAAEGGAYDGRAQQRRLELLPNLSGWLMVGQLGRPRSPREA